jgi:hypothetical protein
MDRINNITSRMFNIQNNNLVRMMGEAGNFEDKIFFKIRSEYMNFILPLTNVLKNSIR